MELSIRKGTVEDAEILIRFLQEVQQGMENKDWLYLDDPEDVRNMMANGTMRLWIAMDADRLAGIFTILFPSFEEYNYGYDLNFTNEQLLRVIHMDTAAVHPDYRGLGLQKQLIRETEAYISGSGDRILLATVHPDNRYSLKNFLDQDYIIEKRVCKYGSERYILRKDL